jgi:hypothetical protein
MHGDVPPMLAPMPPPRRTACQQVRATEVVALDALRVGAPERPAALQLCGSFTQHAAASEGSAPAIIDVQALQVQRGLAVGGDLAVEGATEVQSLTVAGALTALGPVRGPGVAAAPTLYAAGPRPGPVVIPATLPCGSAVQVLQADGGGQPVELPQPAEVYAGYWLAIHNRSADTANLTGGSFTLPSPAGGAEQTVSSYGLAAGGRLVVYSDGEANWNAVSEFSPLRGSPPGKTTCETSGPLIGSSFASGTLVVCREARNPFFPAVPIAATLPVPTLSGAQLNVINRGSLPVALLAPAGTFILAAGQGQVSRYQLDTQTLACFQFSGPDGGAGWWAMTSLAVLK